MKAYVDTVANSVGAEEIARHLRSNESADFVFEPPQYLALLEMKVGALDQPAPLSGLGAARRVLDAAAPAGGAAERPNVNKH